MIYHTRAVARGAKSSFIISDLPIHTYENNDLAYKSAIALIEVGAHMVKLEGGVSKAPIIQHLKAKDIKVCGHIGFMPQFTQNMNHIQIRDDMKKALETIIEDANILERSGVDMLVLSSIPEDIAKKITQTISIPTIGFHSGKSCDGEVYILYDLLMKSDKSCDLYFNDSIQSNQSIDIKELLIKSIKKHS
jgi:3-methyl-2-oxobutanoate hydroxymethyltransferase